MKILFYLEREVKQKKMGNLKMTVLTMAVPKNFAKINRQQMKKKKKTLYRRYYCKQNTEYCWLTKADNNYCISNVSCQSVLV